MAESEVFMEYLDCGSVEHNSVAFKHVFFEWAVNTEVLFLAGLRGEQNNTSGEDVSKSELVAT